MQITLTVKRQATFPLEVCAPIISERGKTAKTGDSEKMDAEAAFWEERGEGAAATLGKFANDWGAI